MRMNRRNVLVGLGGIVAGGGALLGTGAFSTVEADRTVTIGVAEDSAALIGLEPGNSEYVTTDGDGRLEINLSEDDLGAGINVDADLTIDDAFTVTNNYEGGDVEISFSDDSDEVDFSFDPTPPYTLDSEESEEDIDLIVETQEDVGNFEVTLTISAEPQ